MLSTFSVRRALGMGLDIGRGLIRDEHYTTRKSVNIVWSSYSQISASHITHCTRVYILSS